MSQVGMRELNQDTAGVLTRVKEGEEVEITERGAVVARLVPVQPSPVAELIAAGKLRPATRHGRVPRPAGPVRSENEAGDVLREMRDDERF